MDKDLKKILKAAEAQGFTTRTTKKGHITVYLGNEWITTLSGTASDHRSTLNALAALKRAGLQWPPG